MECAEKNEKGYFKIRHRQRFRLSQNACQAAGLRPDPLRELKRCPDFIFRSQMHQKRLAAGLRPDPLGSLSAPPCPLSAVGAMEGNNSPVQLGAHCGEEEGGGSVEGLLLNLSSREISSSSQNACLATELRPDPQRELKRPDFIFRSQMHQKRLATGLRPDPLVELERFPRPQWVS